MARLQPYPNLHPHRLHRRQRSPCSPGAAPPPAAPPHTTGPASRTGPDTGPHSTGLNDWQHLLLTAALGFAVSLGTGLVAGLLCAP